MTFPLAVAIAVVFGGMCWKTGAAIRASWFIMRLWYWLSGEAHHGKPVTNAGWFRRGYGPALTRTGHCHRWWYRPRWQRASHRTGGSLAFITMLWGLVSALMLTLWLLGAAMLAITGFGMWRGWAKLRRRRDERTWLLPLHIAAHELAGHPRAIRAASWIHPVMGDDGAVVEARLELPQGWAADPREEQQLERIAAAKLGIEAAEPTWRRAGPAPLLILRHSPPPPREVTMAQLLPELGKCQRNELIIGVGKNGELIKVSLYSDSPHIAISMGTGAGKSNLAGWLLFQMLLRGGIGMVLDPKRRLSYPWILKDADRNVVQLPNVAYAWTIPMIHQSMSWLSTELYRRADVAFAGMDTGGEVHATVGPMMGIIAEELNLAVPELKSHWQEIRGDGQPAKSPAFTGLGATAFAGRQVWKHLILVGQMLTAEATGSRDSSVKEQCGVKLLARYGPKGWRIMAEDIPMPPPPTVLGRVQVISAGAAREAQTPLFDPWAGRRMALEGDITPLPSGMPCGPPRPVVPGSEIVPVPPSDQALSYETPPWLSQPRSLRELSADKGDGVTERTLFALRKAAQRRQQTGFPDPVASDRQRGDLFDPIAVADWDVMTR